jgi:hypothetical protein
MLKAARFYARHGVPVFPLHTVKDGKCSCGNPSCDGNKGKHPRVSGGFKSATTNLDTVVEWWEKWPDANIGAPTGEASGWVVLDVDGPNVEDTVAELGAAVPTRTATTVRGRHLYFRYPGQPITSTAGINGAALDFKGDGGYVILPPSLRRDGKRYQWDKGRDMGWECEPAPMPAKLLEALKNGGERGLAEPIPERIPEGERNDTLTSIAGTLRRPGLSASAIYAALLDDNAKRCDPPLPEGEVRRIAESIGSKPPRSKERGGPEPTERPDRAPILIADLVARPDTPPDWVVPGYAARKEVTLWTGPPKIGKTTIEREKAVRTAHGGEYLGRLIKPTPVLWWNLEEAPRRCEQRFRELARKLGVGDIPLHIMSTRDKRFDWQSYAVEHGIGFVLIDSLAKAWDVEDANDQTQTERAIELLRLGAERCNAAVEAVYHNRKSGGKHGEGILGSTQILAQVDYAVTMERHTKNENWRILNAVSRDDETPACLIVKYEEGLYYTLGTGRQVQAEENRQRVMVTLQALGPDQTGKDIAAATGTGTKEDPCMSPPTVNRALNDLLERQQITRTGEGKKGDPYRYSLVR